VNGNWLDLGFMRYEPAFVIQERALEARVSGLLPPTVILQENPPTFTIGRSGSQANVLASPDELAARGIELIEVNRGGDVTYHGPGQLIASPLLYLGDIGLNANQYLHRLETVLIDVLAEFGLAATPREGYPGAWLGEAKIGAVGIAVRHGYTFHGLSLNVNLDLAAFQLINPCGVAAMPVTSMQVALGRRVPKDRVKAVLRRTLESAFGLSLRDVSLAEIRLDLDLAQARALLTSEGLAFALVHDGHVLHTSRQPGIVDLLTTVYELDGEAGLAAPLRGAALVDRIIGKAVAQVVRQTGIAAAYAGVLSEPARAVLSDIRLVYDQLVPAILNQRGTDLCPMERLVLTLDDPAEAVSALRAFLQHRQSG
jgi:lipoyl(octanoyl) transferase